MKKYEETIKKTILEADYVYEKKEIADKYQSYLIRYISLLSDEDEEAAAMEVTKPFYSINDCLTAVRIKKNKYAEAVLVRRNGDLLEAVKIYMQIID